MKGLFARYKEAGTSGGSGRTPDGSSSSGTIGSGRSLEVTPRVGSLHSSPLDGATENAWSSEYEIEEST